MQLADQFRAFGAGMSLRVSVTVTGSREPPCSSPLGRAWACSAGSLGGHEPASECYSDGEQGAVLKTSAAGAAAP